MSTGTTSAPAIRYSAVTFDCPDPAELARFYGDALGLPVVYSSDDFILLGQEGSPGLGFCGLANYQRPTWPDPSQEKRPTSNWVSTTSMPPRPGCWPLAPWSPRPSRGLIGGGSCWTPPGDPFCISTLV